MKYRYLVFTVILSAQSVFLTPATAEAVGLGFSAAAGGKLEQSVSYQVSKVIDNRGLKALKIDSISGANKEVLTSVFLPEQAALQDLATASRLGHKVVVVDSWTKMQLMFEKTRTAAFTRTTTDVIFRFPPEAFGFFLAIGILNVKDLATNFANNPVLLEQYLSSQKDPVGHLGFLAFMMANSHISGPLLAATDPSAKLTRAMIPYLGMSVGMLASNVVHEVAHIGDVSKCVADLNTRVADEKKYASCEKAYNTWMSYSWEKSMELAPGLMSMVGSTLASGAIERFALQKSVMAMGWQVLLSTTPAGWSVRGARFLYKILQFGMFTQLDIWIRPLIEIPFRNLREGGAFNGYERNLMTLLADKKTNSWKQTRSNADEKNYDLDLELRQFGSKMKSWREFNMSEILMAHSSWLQYLSNFSLTYQGAKNFYPTFLKELIIRATTTPQSQSLTQLPMPLNGVTPKAPEIEGAKLDLWGMPSEYRNRQIETLIDVRKKYEAAMQTKEAKRLLALRPGGEVITQILEMLPTENDYRKNDLNTNRMGQALDLLLRSLRQGTQRIPRYPGLSSTPEVWARFGDYRDILAAIYSDIGQPEPIWQNGVGFFVAYEKDQQAQELQSLVHTPMRSQMITTFKPAQYYVAQMLLGPNMDQNEGVARNPWGGLAEFVPPRITIPLEFDFLQPVASGGAANEQITLFNVPVEASLKGSNGRYSKKYKNFFEAVNIQSIIPSVLTPNLESNMTRWWNERIEPKFIQAFAEYEDKYQEILVKLVEKMQDKSESRFNTGNAASNVLDSLRQERRVYLMTLGEIFKDLSLDQHKPFKTFDRISQKTSAQSHEQSNKPISSELRGIQAKPWEVQDLTSKTHAANKNNTEVQDATPLVPLLKIVQTTANMNLSYILKSMESKQIKTFNRDSSTGNLPFQNEVENQFQKIEALLANYQVQAVEQGIINIQLDDGTQSEVQTTRKIVVSDVTNKQIEESEKGLTAAIKNIERIFATQKLQLSDFQSKLIQTCLQGLNAVAAETANLGKMANSVSYKRQNSEQRGMIIEHQDCLKNAAISTKTDPSGRTYQLAAVECKKLALEATTQK